MEIRGSALYFNAPQKKQLLLTLTPMADFRKLLIILNIFLCCFALPRAPLAETLEIPATDLKTSFDYHMPYRGQTFVFPEEVLAETLTVYVSPNIFQSFTFNLLITEVDTANGVHPTTILFESSPCVIPVGGKKDFIPCTANTGGILLSAGQTYAFILDIFTSLSGKDSDLLWQYATLTGMNEDAIYPLGEYIYFSSECTDALTGLPCGDREDHFAGSWAVETTMDMAFILEYTPVIHPFSPSVIELLLLGN